MRFILKVRIPIEKGNIQIKDPEFGHKMAEILKDINAEVAYFGTIDGQRGGYVVVNMNDASEMTKVAEPFFLFLNADVEAQPVMLLEDLQKGGPFLGAAVQKWGK
jgi:hypothetical protein